MKTTTADHKNHFLLCESLLHSFCSLHFLQVALSSAQNLLAKRNPRLSSTMAFLVSAKQEILVTLAAASKAISNYRIYLGILTIILSEYASKCYLLFDSSVGNKSDFWNAYFFVYAIREGVAVIFFATGVFILFHSNKLSIVTLIPLSYKFTHIIYLACIPTSDFTKANELVRTMPLWSHFLMGVSFSLCWIKLFDYLMKLHYHKIMGTVARLVNIMRAPNIPNEKRIEIATNEANHYVELISK